jgi:hypothetical protein
VDGKSGKKGKGKKLRRYVWDATHGHWEVYDRKGRNIYSLSNEGDILEEFKNDRKRLVL